MVPRPICRQYIGNRCAFKIKRFLIGSIERLKACLIAKGYNQVIGFDFSERFSPVIKFTTIRVILTIALHYGWELRQVDVNNAFLHGILEDEVFIDQQEGFLGP